MMWNECKDLQDYIVSMRRDLHKIPELGLNLPKTRDYVTAKLDEYGIPYKLSEKDSSIIATLKGGKPGKTVALRADMDALPITEETGLEFASTHPGCMHACGHDTHASMLLGAAKVLAAHKDELCGEVRFLFQTAEEIAKGSRIVIENGGIDGVDAIYGMHIGSILDKNIPAGTFIVCPGAVMASYDRYVIKVKGAACHGSTPEKGIDPINIAAHVVLGLEAIIAREFNACDPCVVTVGKIAGGSQYNVIPDEVVLEGTTRAFKEEVRQKMATRIEQIAKSTAEAFGGTIEFLMDWGAAPVINTPENAVFAAEAVKEIFGDNMQTSRPAPNMAGEDFAEYLAKVPGAFMFLSSSNPAKHTDVAHHNSKFDVDEDVLWMGSAAFVAITEKYLNA